MKAESKKIDYLTVTYFASLFAVAVFHDYLSCFFSVAIIIGLFYMKKNSDCFEVKINLISISVTVICAAYLICTIWAVDRGMALTGFFKFMPVFLFLIYIMQKQQAVEQIHKYLPYASAVMCAVSFLFMQIPALHDKFSVAGRLSGFLQYPNTFALLMLVSELLLIRKEELKKKDFAVIAILLAGIILSGSRTVFALMIIANIVMIIAVLGKRNRKMILITVIGAVAVMIAAALLLGGNYIVERFTDYSLSESTFAGRLLYWQDALPVILQHPFGLGYMGHYYLQQSIQTGLYSIRFVHNEFLQIALDVGLIPCILFAAAAVKTFVSKNVEFYKKIIAAVIVLHCGFDFDLQFIAVFCLLITFMQYDEGSREIRIKCGAAAKAVMVILIAANLYMGLALGSAHFNKVDMADAMYPWNTQNQQKMIIMTADVEEQEKLADEIISRNEYVVLAYSVKARNAYSHGDFSELIQWKHKLFEKAPLQYEEYKEYCSMLINGISLYSQAGDMNSAGICAGELLQAEQALASMSEKLSDLGKKIKDQPETELPHEIQNYIDALRGGK